MAIYFPEMFCGVGSILVIKEPFCIEFDDGQTLEYFIGEICEIDAIIGYGYNIFKRGTYNIFRIKNGEMNTYFELQKKVPFIEEISDEIEKLPIVRLKKKFVIKDIVAFNEGFQFYHEKIMTDRLFHNLYCKQSKRIVLRMKDEEFNEYILIS